MKAIKLMVCMAALFCATIVMAQNPSGGKGCGMMNATPAEKAQRMTEMLKKRVNLTDDQVKQVQTIYTNYFTKESVLRTERESAINKTLTPEQHKKMKEMREKMQQRGSHDGEHPKH